MQQEYARACLIAYESRPKDGFQEGWGRPGASGVPLAGSLGVSFTTRAGSKYAGIRFRTSLLDSVRTIGECPAPGYEHPSNPTLALTRNRQACAPGHPPTSTAPPACADAAPLPLHPPFARQGRGRAYASALLRLCYTVSATFLQGADRARIRHRHPRGEGDRDYVSAPLSNVRCRGRTQWVRRAA